MSASRKKYTSIVDVAGKELAEEHQHLRHLSNEMISDPEGKDFWLKLFGAEVPSHPLFPSPWVVDT